MTRSAPLRNASPSGAPRITAVVPTFNGGRLLERCLDATLDAAEVDEVIVLDGGSTDGSPERAERRDRIRVLRRPDLCVMARINVGVAEARNGLVLILNDDAFVDRDTPRRLAEVLVEQPITALVGAHLRSEDGRPQRSASHFRTLLAETLSALGLGRALRGILIRAPIRARADGADEVTLLPLCAVLARRAALDRAGGLDERYQFYFDDEDICRRLVKAGWKVLVRWDAGAVHVGGGSTRAHDPPGWYRQYNRARFMYLRKFYPRGWRVAAAAWGLRARLHALGWRLRAARHRMRADGAGEQRAREWAAAFDDSRRGEAQMTASNPSGGRG